MGTSPGDYVLLSISDSGTGMDKKTRKHIFDPFFTTKATGKGTGLGLSIAFGIVKSHGGHIICRTEPGRGTTFKIYLPAFRAVHDETERRPISDLTGGDETILLVEDEESVRKLAAHVLKKFGYTVLTASNGKEAMEVFSQEMGTDRPCRSRPDNARNGRKRLPQEYLETGTPYEGHHSQRLCGQWGNRRRSRRWSRLIDQKAL